MAKITLLASIVKTSPNNLFTTAVRLAAVFSSWADYFLRVKLPGAKLMVALVLDIKDV